MYGLYGCSKQPPPLLPPLPQPLARTPARCRHLLSHYRRRNRCRCHWNALLLLPAFPALASMQPQLLALPLTLPSMPLPQEAFLDFASMEALPLALARSMPLPPPLPPPLPLALPSMSVQLEAFLAFASAHPLPLARARSMPLPPPLPPTRPLTLPSMSVQLEAFLAFASAQPLPLARARSMQLPLPLPCLCRLDHGLCRGLDHCLCHVHPLRRHHRT